MSEVCANDMLFGRLKSAIETYMSTFTSAKYASRVAVTVNLNCPFEFQYEADRQQVSQFQLVYQKSYVKISVQCWEEMWKQGLLDPNHTIGTRLPSGLAAWPVYWPYT